MLQADHTMWTNHDTILILGRSESLP